MHELSLVHNIFNSLEAEFSLDKLRQMRKIHLKIGPLSNIEPLLLQNAFEAFNETEKKYPRVNLAIQTTDIKIECEVCTHITTVQNYRFICENCGRPSKNIIQGEEMLIHKIEFED
jgi:hydrogenase nickel incorporation protein HypA/HybF